MPHKSKYTKTERKGLPGGPNEMFSYVTGVFSTEGYKLDSPDFDNPFNVIKGDKDGTSITMDNVPFSILGTDDLGNSTIMKPGQDYKFPGGRVFELPLRDTLEYTKKTKDKKNTRFGLSADLKKIKPRFSTILPTQTEIDIKGTLPLQYFESVLPFDVKPFSKGNIDIGINQPLSSRTDIGVDFNIPLKGNPNKRMDPLLSFKHRFQEGGTTLPELEVSSDAQYYDKEGNLLAEVPNYGTIYTTDRNDPRLKEYEDRLYLYKLSRDNYLNIVGDRFDDRIEGMKDTIDYWNSIGEPDQAKEPKKILENLIEERKNLSSKDYLNYYRGQKGQGYDVSETDLFDDIISGNYDRFKRYGRMITSNEWKNLPQKELNKIAGLHYSRGLDQKEADILAEGLKLGYEPYIDSMGKNSLLTIDYPYPSLTVKYKKPEKEDTDSNDPESKQYLLDLEKYNQRNIDIENERLDAIERYNRLEPGVKDSRTLDEYLQSVLMLKPLPKPIQKYADETEAAVLNAEEAEESKTLFKVGDKYLEAKDIKGEFIPGKGFETFPEKKPLSEERRLTPMTFGKGGTVSWDWKGKSYSGTLIPSMETETNRYARTHNGKIKTLPKAQEGNKEQATISQYEEPAWYEKAVDYLASPMTSFGYTVRGQDLPDRLPINAENRNVYDMVIDMVNPFAWAKYAASAKRNLKEEEYANATFDALGAIPIVPAWLSKGKFLKNVKGVDNLVPDGVIKSTVKNVKPNAKDLRFVDQVNPLTQDQAKNLLKEGLDSKVFSAFEEGAQTIDDFVKSYTGDLSSPEGFKRLVKQEADYLKSIGFDEAKIAYQAEINAAARLDEIAKINNVNRVQTTFLKDASNIVKNPKKFDNASYTPNRRFEEGYLEDLYYPDGFKPKDISFTTNKTKVGGKVLPGDVTLSTFFGRNKSVAAHEIGGHGLQSGRKLKVDDVLKKNLVKSDDISEFYMTSDSQLDKAYEYFKHGSKGREPSAYLHELRQAMLDAKLIRNRYDYISPDLIEKAKMIFDKYPSGTADVAGNKFFSNTRILDIMAPVQKNFNLISTELNKLPAMVPIGIGAAGAAGLSQGQDSQEEYQEGGPMSRAERIYNLIPPTGYNDIGNIFNYFKVDSDSPVPVRTEMTDPRGEEMYKQYLGINTTPAYLRPSSSKPSIAKDKNVQYYQLDPELEKSIFGAVGNTLKVGDIKQMGELDLPERFNVDDNYGGYNMWSGLGNFTVSKGVDDEGKEYISYYDKYDLPDYIQDRLKGQPYEVYGRINPNMVREFQGSEIQDQKDYDAIYGEGAYRKQFLEKVNPQHLVSGTTDILNKQRLFREDMKNAVSSKKLQRGGTVSEIWEEVTGTPWSTAKEQGLTDGGYNSNIELRNQLIQSPSKFKKKPSNSLPPANTNSNAANPTLSAEEVNDKINKAKDFNAAFGIARNYYGANKIFEYNGKQFGTNLSGETFEPSEEDMMTAGLKREQREKINKQNQLVTSPYTDNNVVDFDEYEDFESIKKNQDNFNRMNQADLIVSYQTANATKPYLIVDENAGRMHLYYPGEQEPKESYPILSGVNEGDAQTVTKADYFYNGKKLDQADLNKAMQDTNAKSVDALMEMPGYYAQTNWKAGNKTTGAGKFTIGAVNEDSGYYDESGRNRKTPSFILKNEAGNEVSSVIHTVPSSASAGRINALTAQDPANMRMTNGCINGRCSDLTDMHNIHDIGEGSEIFILPEDKGNKFVYQNGQLNFRPTRENRQSYDTYIDEEDNEQRGQGVNRTVNTLNYKPIKIDIDEEAFRMNKPDLDEEYTNTVVPFVKSLEDNKQKVMKALKINGDVYNDIAGVAFGILGNETGFGETHSAIGNTLRGGRKVASTMFDKLIDSIGAPDSFKIGPTGSVDYQTEREINNTLESFGLTDSDDSSMGLTQVRWSQIEQEQPLLEALASVGITKGEDFDDPAKAALGTVAMLAFLRNNRQGGNVPIEDLPRLYAGSSSSDPQRKAYTRNALDNAKYLNIKQKKYQKAGEVDDGAKQPNKYNAIIDNLMKKIYGDLYSAADTTQKVETKSGLTNDLLMAQAFAESSFRPNVTSSANATGLTQIRPNVLSDYKEAKGIKEEVDLTNIDNAIAVQKWYMDNLYNASFIDKPDQSEDVRIAKTLGAYNWGRGHMVDFLNKKKKDGDIYNSLDWVDDLPRETKDYINKIMGNNEKFNKDFEKVIADDKFSYIVNEYKALGGEISDLKIYKDYINGIYDSKPNLEKAELIYDKLNRVYYNKAGQVGMSAPNYIMSYLIDGSI